MKLGKAARQVGKTGLASIVALLGGGPALGIEGQIGVVGPTSAQRLVACTVSLGDAGRYRLCDMPDFDQKWDSLAAGDVGVGGDMYCVPTATMNVFAVRLDVELVDDATLSADFSIR